MPANSKELREQRGPIIAETRRLADLISDEKRSFTAEEEVAWKKLNDDDTALMARVAAAERAEKMEAEGRAVEDREERDAAGNKKKPKPGREDTERRKAGDPDIEEQRSLALQAWCRYQVGAPLKRRHLEAAKATKIPYKANSLRVNLARDYKEVRDHRRIAERRNLSVFTQTAGGYTVPTTFSTSLETNMLAYCDVRRIADVMRTDNGRDMVCPTADDTGNKATIIGEAVAQSTTVQPTYAQMILRAWKYSSGMVLFGSEFESDTGFDFGSWLAERLAERIGRRQADDFTFGTGAGQPTGIVTAATLGVTAASATGIAADELYTLKHKIDPAYRQGSGFMFHDQTLLFIKKLKDAQGRYLWQGSMAQGVPDTIDGDPIFINQSMDQIATTKKTVVYGQLSKYKVRDVNDVRIMRLVERFADQDLIGIGCFWRSDANLLDAGSHPVKYLQQA
jgi:HK97 family phage major capsid protein